MIKPILMLALFLAAVSQETYPIPKNQINSILGFTILTPKVDSLLYMPGSSILLVYDASQSKYKPVNYNSETILDFKELNFEVGRQCWINGDLIAIEEKNKFNVYVYDFRFGSLTLLDKLDIKANLLDMASDGTNLILLSEVNIKIVDYAKNIVKVQLNLNTYTPNGLTFKHMAVFQERSQVVIHHSDNSFKIFDYSLQQISLVREFSDKTNSITRMIKIGGSSDLFATYYEADFKVKAWNIEKMTISTGNLVTSFAQKASTFKSTETGIIVIGSSLAGSIDLIDSKSLQILKTLTYANSIVDIVGLADKSQTEGSFAILDSKGLVSVYVYDKAVNTATLKTFFNEKISSLPAKVDTFVVLKYNVNSMRAILMDASNKKELYIIDMFTRTFINKITVSNDIQDVIQLGGSNFFALIEGTSISFYDQTTITTSLIPNPVTYTSVTAVTVANDINDGSDYYLMIYDENNIKIIKTDGTAINKDQTISNVLFFCEMNTFLKFSMVVSDVSSNKLLKVWSFDLPTLTFSPIDLANPISQTNLDQCFNSYTHSVFYAFTSNSLKIYEKTGSLKQEVTGVTSVNIHQSTSSYLTIFKSASNSAAILKYSDGTTDSSTIADMGFPSSYDDVYLIKNSNAQYSFLAQKNLEILIKLASTCASTLKATENVCLPSCASTEKYDEGTNSCKTLTSCPTSQILITNYKNLNYDACRSCSLMIENCETCGDSENCSKCKSNYYRFSSLANNYFDTCVLKSSNSFLFANSSQTSDGKGLVEKCSAYINRCSICEWGTKCTRCVNSFFVKDIDGTCLDCSSSTNYKINAALTDGSGICYSCNKNLPNCLECKAFGEECSKCALGFYIDSLADCQACQQLNCQACSFVQATSSTSCDLCFEGYYLKENTCFPFYYPKTNTISLKTATDTSYFYDWNNQKYLKVDNACTGKQMTVEKMNIFWIFGKTEDAIKTITDLNSIKLALGANNYTNVRETDLNYGLNKNNKFLAPVKFNSNVFIKYFCADEAQTNYIHANSSGAIIYDSIKNTAGNLKLFLTYEKSLSNSDLLKSLCLVESALKIPKINNNCSTLKLINSRRILDAYIDSSVSYSLLYEKDNYLITDLVYGEFNNLLKNQTLFLETINSDSSLPKIINIANLTFDESTSNKDEAPTISAKINFADENRASIIFNSINLDGVIMVGSDLTPINMANEIVPKLENFVNGLKTTNINFAFFKSYLIKYNSPYTLTFNNLTNEKEYIIYYIGKNFAGSLLSPAVFNITFKTRPQFKPDEDFRLGLGIGIGLGIPLLLFLIYVILKRCRNSKGKGRIKNLDSDDLDENDKFKTKLPYKKPDVNDNEDPVALDNHDSASEKSDKSERE